MSMIVFGMDEYTHMYDAVGSHEGGDKLSDKTERITSLNDEQKYMTRVCGLQKEGPCEYQELHQHTRNTRAVISNDEVKGPSDCQVLKDKLKQTKRCLCVLSLLIAILFLTTISSLSLAAYSIGSSATVEHQLNTINSEVVSQRNLQSQLNLKYMWLNTEVSSLQTMLRNQPRK